jgi:hypothetical protein
MKIVFKTQLRDAQSAWNERSITDGKMSEWKPDGGAESQCLSAFTDEGRVYSVGRRWAWTVNRAW